MTMNKPRAVSNNKKTPPNYTAEHRQCKAPGCSYKPKTKEDFQNHVKKHPDVYEFICEYCGYRFHTSGALERHNSDGHKHLEDGPVWQPTFLQQRLVLFFYLLFGDFGQSEVMIKALDLDRSVYRPTRLQFYRYLHLNAAYFRSHERTPATLDAFAQKYGLVDVVAHIKQNEGLQPLLRDVL